ncbi:HIT domain-containing protein [archaeon]|jgi:histidine triad (HIT) family protein|nr:HIT domain-containing protein [archaeon]
MEDDCIFCKIASKEISKDLVYEDENFIGFLDINPRADGHTLIVSKKHYKSLLDIPNSLGNELQEAVKKAGLDLINSGKAEGFNVLVNVGEVADQVVHHLHIHVIPRNDGDSVRLFS